MFEKKIHKETDTKRIEKNKAKERKNYISIAPKKSNVSKKFCPCPLQENLKSG